LRSALYRFLRASNFGNGFLARAAIFGIWPHATDGRGRKPGAIDWPVESPLVTSLRPRATPENPSAYASFLFRAALRELLGKTLSRCLKFPIAKNYT
jgi:hypothetical protein